jgi:mRNA interferase YafQ
MNYTIKLTATVRRALRKYSRSGAFDRAKFDMAIHHLEHGELLPTQLHDHKLQGEMTGFRECHLGFDLLLIHKKNEEARMITLTELGTHQELFGE